jgi:hypothetical protein
MKLNAAPLMLPSGAAARDQTECQLLKGWACGQITLGALQCDQLRCASNFRRSGRADSFDLGHGGVNENKVPWLGVAGTAHRSTTSLDCTGLKFGVRNVCASSSAAASRQNLFVGAQRSAPDAALGSSGAGLMACQLLKG